jgi:type I restriction enzyme S subunit
LNKINKHSFSTLYDIASGISTTKAQAGHGSPFVSFSTVFNNYFLPEVLPDLMDASKSEQETYSVKKGDIFLTRTSETIDDLAMSCVALKDYPCATFSGFTKRLRPKATGIAYHKYLGFYLRGHLFRQSVTNHSIMTLRSSFNEEIFALLNLYLPEYKQQVKIGDFLYSIEQKIKLNNAINAELEKAAKLLYDYWFAQFDFPNAEGKPYRAGGGKMVYNERLKREMPKGWQAVAFNEIVEENKRPLPDGMDKTGLLGLDLSIMPGNTMCLNQRGNAKDFNSNRFRLSKYDLLFGSIRPYLRKAGFSTFDGVANGTIINLRCKDKQDYSFALCTLTGNGLFQYADTRSRGNGTRMPTINAGELMGYTVAYDQKIALAFNNQVSRYWEMIASNINQNFELAEIRDFLIPLLMNGQVTVATGEAAVTEVKTPAVPTASGAKTR